MTQSRRIRFYLWDRTGMAETQYPGGTRYVRKEDYDALKEDYRARPSIQSYADQVARVQALESRIRDLEACVLEYWHAKDWAAVGAADATAAKLLPADMKARAALAPAVAKEQP